MSDKIPDCFGEFWCPDDCIVSCPYWQECMDERDGEIDEER